MFRVRTLAATLFAIVFGAFLCLVLWALVTGSLDSPRAIGVVVLGGLAISSFFLAVGALDAGAGISVESHWGGLGGGVGGLRVSLPLAFVVAALGFAGAAAAVLASMPAAP